MPWGRFATAVYFLHDGMIAKHVAPFEIIREGANIAGEPRDALAPPATPAELSDVALCWRGVARDECALQRRTDGWGRWRKRSSSLPTCSAAGAIRPTDRKFQAVQQMLASLAAHAAAAGAAVDLAASEFSSFTAAIAKSRASDAVALVTDAAHQVCGAMGFTVEFPLQQLTRRLWAWREESGNERFWNERIGTAIANRAQRGVWGLLSDLRLMEL